MLKPQAMFACYNIAALYRVFYDPELYMLYAHSCGMWLHCSPPLFLIKLKRESILLRLQLMTAQRKEVYASVLYLWQWESKRRIMWYVLLSGLSSRSKKKLHTGDTLTRTSTSPFLSSSMHQCMQHFQKKTEKNLQDLKASEIIRLPGWKEKFFFLKKKSNRKEAILSYQKLGVCAPCGSLLHTRGLINNSFFLLQIFRKSCGDKQRNAIIMYCLLITLQFDMFR